MLPGCPGPLEAFKKFAQKTFVLLLRPLELLNSVKYRVEEARAISCFGSTLRPMHA